MVNRIYPGAIRPDKKEYKSSALSYRYVGYCIDLMIFVTS